MRQMMGLVLFTSFLNTFSYSDNAEYSICISIWEEYQDTLESLPIYQNAPLSSESTKLPLREKNTLYKVIIRSNLQALLTRIPLKHKFLHLSVLWVLYN